MKNHAHAHAHARNRNRVEDLIPTRRTLQPGERLEIRGEKLKH